MEIVLVILAAAVVFLLDHARRVGRCLLAFRSEMEKHSAHIAAQRAAYNALFEEVRELKRKMYNE